MLGTFIVASIAYIVLGLFMVRDPNAVKNGLYLVFGISILLYGIINTVSFFINKDNEENLFLELAFGVIACAVGIFSLVSPGIINGILLQVIVIVLVIDGAVNIKRSFNLKAYGMTRWYIFLITAAITVVAGILSIILYSAIENAIVVIMGIILIYEGVSSLVTMITVARYKRKITKQLALIEQHR